MNACHIEHVYSKMPLQMRTARDSQQYRCMQQEQSTTRHNSSCLACREFVHLIIHIKYRLYYFWKHQSSFRCCEPSLTWKSSRPRRAVQFSLLTHPKVSIHLGTALKRSAMRLASWTCTAAEAMLAPLSRPTTMAMYASLQPTAAQRTHGHL